MKRSSKSIGCCEGPGASVGAALRAAIWSGSGSHCDSALPLPNTLEHPSRGPSGRRFLVLAWQDLFDAGLRPDGPLERSPGRDGFIVPPWVGVENEQEP